MNEHDILFKGAMVRALLHPDAEVRKTQTRRLVKPGPKPYARVGDVLRVRESFRLPANLDALSPTAVGDKAMDAGYSGPWSPCVYEADGEYNGAVDRWSLANQWGGIGKLRPGIHMPTWLVRIRHKVKAIRQERLREITEADAIAEGVLTLPGDSDPTTRFHELWASIHGDPHGDIQAANPLVWVVSW